MYRRSLVKHKMDHLVCFVPGMLALGVRAGALTAPDAAALAAKEASYLDAAARVTHTCWQMYHTQPTGALRARGREGARGRFACCSGLPRSSRARRRRTLHSAQPAGQPLRLLD